MFFFNFFLKNSVKIFAKMRLRSPGAQVAVWREDAITFIISSQSTDQSVPAPAPAPVLAPVGSTALSIMRSYVHQQLCKWHAHVNVNVNVKNVK